MKFRVNDVVEIIEDFFTNGVEFYKGEIGTIVDINNGCPPIGVHWKEKRNSNFHDCNGKCPKNEGYFVYEHNIKLHEGSLKKESSEFLLDLSEIDVEETKKNLPKEFSIYVRNEDIENNFLEFCEILKIKWANGLKATKFKTSDGWNYINYEENLSQSSKPVKNADYDLKKINNFIVRKKKEKSITGFEIGDRVELIRYGGFSFDKVGNRGTVVDLNSTISVLWDHIEHPDYIEKPWIYHECEIKKINDKIVMIDSLEGLKDAPNDLKGMQEELYVETMSKEALEKFAGLCKIPPSHLDFSYDKNESIIKRRIL